MEHGWVYGMQAKNGSRKGSGLAPGAGWFPTRDRAESPAAWESAPGTRDVIDHVTAHALMTWLFGH